MPTNPRTLALITAAILVAGVVWVVFLKTQLQPGATPPIEHLPPGPVPDFTLTESRGQPVTRADLLGKIWVANLMFTSCGDTCPALSAAMSRLDRALGPRADLRLVSITITPEYD
jgi:cytochrome oxidase Cu insertion factor (SCO1/SenC/PrrC family)